MLDPIFWLGLSILLVAVSLTAVLIAALPALQELARAARSAEKLFDTLSRELPPTLESIRLTGMEISDLTDDVSEGVQSAGRVVQQVDQGIGGVRNQARQAKVTTRSMVAGFRAAWKTFRQGQTPRRSIDRLPPGAANPVELDENYPRHTAYRREDTDYSDDYSDEYGDEYGDDESLNPASEATNRRPSHPYSLIEEDEALEPKIDRPEEPHNPTRPD